MKMRCVSWIISGNQIDNSCGNQIDNKTINQNDD